MLLCGSYSVMCIEWNVFAAGTAQLKALRNISVTGICHRTLDSAEKQQEALDAVSLAP